MKNLFILLVGLLPTLLFSQANSHNVLFPSGVHALDASAISAAESFLQSAAVPYPCLKVTLRGHTDADGDEAANIALSKRRVEAVKALLLKWGVPASNLSVDAKGESAPVADNESDQGKSQNRRVEVRVVKTTGDCNPLSKGVPMEDIRFTAEKGLEYTYPRSGTRIRIPANALVDAKGRPVKGEVHLHYREWRDAADFVFSGIPMQFPENGSGTLFHSGGMYEVRAEQNGKPVGLASGQRVEVDFALTSAERFDRFAFANGAWTQLGTGQQGPGGGSGGMQKVEEEKCNEYLTAIGADTLTEFRSALYRGLRLASLPKPKGKSITRVTAAHAWESKEYMGGNWVGPKPEAQLVEKAHCLSLRSTATPKAVGKGHRIEVVDRSGVFRELQSLANVMMILRTDDYDKLKDQFQGKKFCDVRVRRRFANSGVISLKHAKGYLELPVLLKGAPKKGQNGADFPSKRFRENVKLAFEKYQRALNGRFVEKNAERVDAQLQTLSRPLMSGDELCLNLVEWEAYFKAHTDSMVKRYSSAIERYDLDDAAARKCISTYLGERKVRLDSGKSFNRAEFNRQQLSVPAWSSNEKDAFTRSYAFSVMLWNQGFGVFNCDQLQRLPSPLVVTASFRTDSGTVKPCNTYCLYKELNGMMQGDVSHKSNDQLYLSSVWTTRAVLVMGFDGELYLADKQDIENAGKVTKRDRPTIHLKEITSLADTPEKLRELLKKFAA